MVEVIVASVLFATSAAGIFATINLVTSRNGDPGAKMKAALFAQRVLEGLDKKVSTLTWNTDLSLGTHAWPITEFAGYSATYTVTDDALVPGARKVEVNVHW